MTSRRVERPRTVNDWSATPTASSVGRATVLVGSGCAPTASLRPARPSRGLFLSTGEDIPPGQSLRGRMLIIEVSPGDVPLSGLTAHQQAAAAGRFAEALAGFVGWLAPQYGDLCGQLPSERTELRDRVQTGTGSARTSSIVADLALALRCFLDFALTVKAITAPERNELARRGWAALQEAAAAQREHVEVAEPCGHFLRLLAGAVASGRCHVAGPTGDAPENPERWGWREATVGAGKHVRQEWRPLKDRIGWADGADLYLEPEASYAAASALAREQGDALPVSRVRSGNGCVSAAYWPAGTRFASGTRSGGHWQGLSGATFCTCAGALSMSEEPSQPSQPSPDRPETQGNGTVLRDGFAPNAAQPSQQTVPGNGQKAVEQLPVGRLGRLGRSDTGGEAPPENESPLVVEAPSPNGSGGSHPKPRRGTL